MERYGYKIFDLEKKSYLEDAPFFEYEDDAEKYCRKELLNGMQLGMSKEEMDRLEEAPTSDILELSGYTVLFDKLTVHDRVSKLEIDTYGHDDNADQIVEDMEDIVKVANPKTIEQKEDIEHLLVRLLENHRFGG